MNLGPPVQQSWDWVRFVVEFTETHQQRDQLGKCAWLEGITYSYEQREMGVPDENRQ